MKKVSDPREAAFLSLIYAKKGDYIENFFEEDIYSMDSKDLRLAKNIAYGTEKRFLSLEYLLNKLIEASGFKNFKIKPKERLLLYSAMYQFFFMEKVPLFAIVNETVSLAKRYFGEQKGSFFNKVLRLLEGCKVGLPEGKEIKDLSYRYSYPEFFIKELIDEYGEESSEDILETQNLFFSPFVRLSSKARAENCEVVHEKKFSVAKITTGDLSFFSRKKEYYIQNITPVLLLEDLLESLEKNLKKPKKILDLCASPGGKTIALHEIFPNAEFTLNDSSKERLNLLLENLQTHEIKAKVLNFSAEDIHLDEKFDLIILDVPCSNSGVLSKRPEARWRIDKSNLEELSKLQLKIIQNAANLLTPQGYIFYMTCSILNEENEEVIKKANGLTIIKTSKILPDKEGKDGGFAALLKKLQKNILE